MRDRWPSGAGDGAAVRVPPCAARWARGRVGFSDRTNREGKFGQQDHEVGGFLMVARLCSGVVRAGDDMQCLLFPGVEKTNAAMD